MTCNIKRFTIFCAVKQTPTKGCKKMLELMTGKSSANADSSYSQCEPDRPDPQEYFEEDGDLERFDKDYDDWENSQREDL